MRHQDHDEFEELLHGRTPAGDRPLRSVADLVSETRRVFATPVPVPIRDRHLEAVLRTFAESPMPATRRRRGRFATKVGALSVGVVLAAGSAMAATGTLPDPAQRQISNAVEHVGLHIPDHGIGSGPTSDDHPTTPAAENKARADRFTDAKKAWTRCVATEASQHEGTPFDPEDACGPKPTPEAAGPKDSEPQTEPGQSGIEHGQGSSHSENAGQEREQGAPADGSDSSSNSSSNQDSNPGSDRKSDGVDRSDRGESAEHTDRATISP